jgi:hypothetical protein
MTKKKGKMTMTPLHQQLIDALLSQVQQRTQELITVTALPIGNTKEQTIEQLRQSPLGVHLTAIANYAEGHAYTFATAHDVRQSIGYVGRAIFGEIEANTYRFPPKFHKMPLGHFINEALARFYREEQPGHLLKVGQVCKRFGVARQTVHEWIEEGRLYATYIDGLAYLSVQDVERIAQYRQRTTMGRSVKDASKNVSADG